MNTKATAICVALSFRIKIQISGPPTWVPLHCHVAALWAPLVKRGSGGAHHIHVAVVGPIGATWQVWGPLRCHVSMWVPQFPGGSCGSPFCCHVAVVGPMGATWPQWPIVKCNGRFFKCNTVFSLNATVKYYIETVHYH